MAHSLDGLLTAGLVRLQLLLLLYLHAFIFRFLSVETRTFSLPRAQTHTVGGAVPRSLQHRLHYP